MRMSARAEDRGDRGPPHYLVQKVREALAHDERVGELELKVKIYGKKVFLTGLVSTPERRAAIDQVLAEVLPDHEIQNETTVGTFTEPPGEEEIS
jgi:osmotically-inducible protein OsmY